MSPADTLRRAVESDDERGVLMAVLERGADPNAVFDPVTRCGHLHHAAASGLARAAGALAACGARLDAPDRSGLTPLMTAARLAHLGVVEVLIAAGADPSSKSGGKLARSYAREEMRAAWPAAGKARLRNIVKILKAAEGRD